MCLQPVQSQQEEVWQIIAQLLPLHEVSGACYPLQSLTLTRDRLWKNCSYEVHATFQLPGTHIGLSSSQVNTSSFHRPVTKLNFCERVIGIGSKQDATLALLLLSMALVVRPELKPDETNLPGTMYYTAKSVHAVLCSTGQPSLELVQAGNLIAQYEYCQGLFEAATASIWSCATMGYTIGLDKTLNQAFAANSSNRSIVEIGRCVWWHIFTLERYVDRVFIATTPLALFPWEFHSSYYIT
jgi:hypothetical protein